MLVGERCARVHRCCCTVTGRAVHITSLIQGEISNKYALPSNGTVNSLLSSLLLVCQIGGKAVTSCVSNCVFIGCLFNFDICILRRSLRGSLDGVVADEPSKNESLARQQICVCPNLMEALPFK